MLVKNDKGVYELVVEFQGNDKDMIWQCLNILNNPNYSDDNHDRAFDKLLDLFSDQIDLEIEMDGGNKEDRQERADTLNYAITQ